MAVDAQLDRIGGAVGPDDPTHLAFVSWDKELDVPNEMPTHWLCGAPVRTLDGFEDDDASMGDEICSECKRLAGGRGR